MNAPLARREFFALEAGEYLERLALLVAEEHPPEGDGLVRYARALRGAALMAGPPGYAVTAAALENVAKALRDGTARWSPALAEGLREGIERGKQLLRRLREWSEDEIALCERAATELNDFVGGPARRSRISEPHAAPTQSAAVRAYIARETAALAAALEQAAEAVEQLAPGGLAPVVDRLQPLRGLGSLPGLSPLPELLEALDLTLVQGGRSGAWPRGAGPAFRATSSALARMARDIAELGLPQSDAPELVQATELLRDGFAGEHDVVPIANLFAAGDTQAVVRRGTPPATPEAPTDVTIELVGLADRLRYSAAQLRDGPAGSARALQLHSLVFSLRGLALGPGVRGGAGDFLSRLDRETMAGRALPAADRVAGLLERAAAILTEASERGSLASLGSLLAPLAEELDQLGAPPVPIESLAPGSDADVVPIESLGYDAVPAYNALEQSFSTYHRLLRDAPVTLPRPPISEPEPLPIGRLLYRGRKALQRADLVRRELDAALRARHDFASLEPLLIELLDLVPLALDDDA